MLKATTSDNDQASQAMPSQQFTCEAFTSEDEAVILVLNVTGDAVSDAKDELDDFIADGWKLSFRQFNTIFNPETRSIEHYLLVILRAKAR